MAEHHIHLYKIERMVHMDIEAPSLEEAQAEALRRADRPDLQWDTTDAKHVAMAFYPNNVVTDRKEDETCH